MIEIGLIHVAEAIGTIIIVVKVTQWAIRFRYYRAYRAYVNKEGTLSAIIQKFGLRNPPRLVAYIESKGVTIGPEEKAQLSVA